jgi:predicted DNA-binding transcriptional regulator YafY
MVLFMPYKICIFRIYASKALGGCSTQREVKPIAIKESQQRWYLVALDKKDDTVKP